MVTYVLHVNWWAILKYAGMFIAGVVVAVVILAAAFERAWRNMPV